MSSTLKEKIQSFVDWLIIKTKSRKISWREEKYGLELFSTYIEKESGKATINLIKNQNDIIIKIHLHKSSYVAPVTFIYSSEDKNSIKNLQALYNIVKEKTKIPEWVKDFLNDIIKPGSSND